MPKVLMLYPGSDPANDLHCVSEAGPLSSYLQQRDVQTEIIRVSEQEECRDLSCLVENTFSYLVLILQAERPGVYKWLNAVIGKTKKINREIKVICVGLMATLFHKELLIYYQGIDSIVVGETEETLAELIGLQRDPSQVKGIAFKRNEEIIKTEKRKQISSCSELPVQDIRYFIDRKTLPVLPIYSNRDCEGNCTFCPMKKYSTYNEAYEGVRRKSPLKVVEEMEMLQKEIDQNIFYFVDGSFISRNQNSQIYVQEFAERIIEKKLKIHFYIETRVDSLKESTLKMLKAAGLRKIFLGIENGSQSVLDRYNKGVVVNDNVKAIELLRELKIDFDPGFIMFDPLTSLKELEENIDFMAKVGINKNRNYAALYKRLMLFPDMPFMKYLDVLEEDLKLVKEEYPLWRNDYIYYRIADPFVRCIEINIIDLRRNVDNVLGIFRNNGKLNSASTKKLFENKVQFMREIPEVFFTTFSEMVKEASRVSVVEFEEYCRLLVKKRLADLHQLL